MISKAFTSAPLFSSILTACTCVCVCVYMYVCICLCVCVCGTSPHIMPSNNQIFAKKMQDKAVLKRCHETNRKSRHFVSSPFFCGSTMWEESFSNAYHSMVVHGSQVERCPFLFVSCVDTGAVFHRFGYCIDVSLFRSLVNVTHARAATHCTKSGERHAEKISRLSPPCRIFRVPAQIPCSKGRWLRMCEKGAPYQHLILHIFYDSNKILWCGYYWRSFLDVMLKKVVLWWSNPTD